MTRWMLLVGPIAAFGVGYALSNNGNSAEIGWTAGVVTLCAVWWVFEPIPIPVTSLIPLAVFPLVGVLTPSQVGACYGTK